MTKINKGFLALFSSAALLGTFGVLIRQLGLYLDIGSQVAVRTFAAAGVALILVVAWKSSLRIPRAKIPALVLFSTVFPLSLLAFTASISETKASNALFMLYVGSLAAGFMIGSFWFKEKVTKVKLFSMVLVIFGLVVFLSPLSISSLTVGVLMGIIAGVLEGTTHAIRKSLQGLKRETLLFYQYLASGFFGLALAAVRTEQLKLDIDLRLIIVTLVFGIALVGMGYLLLYGFKHFDVNVGSVVLASELLFALIINAAFLAEIPTAQEFIGGMIIFLAAISTSIDWDKLRKRLLK